MDYRSRLATALKAGKPSKPLIKLATVIFKDVWCIRIKTFEHDKVLLPRELTKLDMKIDDVQYNTCKIDVVCIDTNCSNSENGFNHKTTYY